MDMKDILPQLFAKRTVKVPMTRIEVEEKVITVQMKQLRVKQETKTTSQK